MKTLFLSIALVLTALSLKAQELVAIDFKLDKVSNIIVDGRFTLVITQGADDYLSGSYPESMADYLSWKLIDGSTLSIELKRPLNMGGEVAKDTLVFNLHLASELESVTATKGAKVISDDMLSMRQLDVSANNDSFVSLRLDCEDLSIKASNASVVFMYGRSAFTDVRSNTLARVDVQDLNSEVVTAEALVDGKILVSADRRLKLDAKTRGQIQYKAGADAVVRKKSSTLGKIEELILE